MLNMFVRSVSAWKNVILSMTMDSLIVSMRIGKLLPFNIVDYLSLQFNAMIIHIIIQRYYWTRILLFCCFHKIANVSFEPKSCSIKQSQINNEYYYEYWQIDLKKQKFNLVWLKEFIDFKISYYKRNYRKTNNAITNIWKRSKKKTNNNNNSKMEKEKRKIIVGCSLETK